MSKDKNVTISRSFYDSLDRSGFPFQYAALRVGREMFENRRSSWVFEVSEFPVQAGENDPGTRIDFILRHKNKNVCMLVECKRANPRLRHWCFARIPYVRRNTESEYFIVDRLRNESGILRADVLNWLVDRKLCYHLGVEVKSSETGDAEGGTPREIEATATQVCRGLNGLVEAFAQDWSMIGEKDSLVLIPAVFTTARLWVSETDISTADIDNGTLKEGRTDLNEREWILYQYHQSEALKFEAIAFSGHGSTFSDMLATRYLRTIPIVNASSIGKFLGEIENHIM